MAAEFRIRAENAPSRPSEPSKFSDLDVQTQQKAFQGLAAAATIYAFAYVTAFSAHWFTLIAAKGYFHFPPLFDSLMALVSIGIALLVAYRCKRTQCTPCFFTRAASMFLVVSSLGIAVQAWGWETASGYEVGSVSWVSVWLVIYPAVVTLAPRQILLASLAAWATLPGTAVLSILIHGTPATFEGSPWIVIARLAISGIICVGIAYAIASRVFCLARDVSTARRLGSYELREKIGAGGMGEVWKAKHRMLARPAAVKLIRPEAIGISGEKTGGRTLMRRFEREAQATALLTSPHSIVLYDFGTTRDGVFYYVMELLEGRDLKSLIRERGPVPAERAVRFLRAVCDSLDDAHHRGLIHRDIKPANIFTCRRGRNFDFIKVLDFGLVKSVRDPSNTLTELTGAGMASGTPGFMAPEMVTGEGIIDGRTDIYSLGCVAYWLLTGRLVFDGNTPMSILIQHVKEAPPPISTRTEIGVPRQLEEIIHACLSKRPEDRPASAAELGSMLDEVATTLPPWTPERAEAWWRTNLPQLYAALLEGQLSPAPPAVVHG